MSETGFSYKMPERGFKQATEGKHFAKVYQIIDLGFQDGGLYNGKMIKPQSKIGLGFILEDGSTIFQNYTFSNDKRGKFWPLVEALQGRKHTAEELRGYDIGTLMGTAAEIRVEHKVSASGKTIAKIKSLEKVEPADQDKVNQIIPDDYAFVVPGRTEDLPKFPPFIQTQYSQQLTEAQYLAKLAEYKAANPKGDEDVNLA